MLIDGATGAGKSTLLESLRSNYSQRVVVGTKLTTRRKRIGDNDWEFRFVERIPQHYSKYFFNSVGNDYAIDHDQLASAISDGFNYAVSCVDTRITRALKSEFDTVVIYLYRALDSAGLKALLASRGDLDLSGTKMRRDELQSITSHYLEMIELYDHVILNLGSETDMANQLSRILRSYGIDPD